MSSLADEKRPLAEASRQSVRRLDPVGLPAEAHFRVRAARAIRDTAPARTPAHRARREAPSRPAATAGPEGTSEA